ncbi:hypothetical protein AGMMS49525_02640 [Bacteroidia bacterium]|nr:hypothetical protein AGMMS49525_02640 [Bacteroidia bacterium]
MKTCEISIVMPAYNAEPYIGEAIQSILNQQNCPRFELLVVDDGSTDGTAKVVRSFKSRRIVLLQKDHNGIVDALNMGLTRAKGKYIARMDADDTCSPERLAIQYRFMEAHPEVDVLGTGMEWSTGGTFSRDGELTKEHLLQGNGMVHASVMMRHESLSRLPVVYETGYLHGEDYQLWLKMTTNGFRLWNIPDVLYFYRQHKTQVSTLFAQEEWDVGKRLQAMYTDELTCIIPFCNEGDEIERTVASIRKTTTSVSILLINDASTDGFDYRSVAEKYGCRYHQNDENAGVAMSRDIGVVLCQTPYFVLLDGHMRFYDAGWETRLLEVLKANEGSLVTSNTVPFHRDENGNYDAAESLTECPKTYGTHGAYVNMDEPGWEFTAKWTHKQLIPLTPSGGTFSPPEGAGGLSPVACVLGAVYAASKAHWQRIGGLWGLKGYGTDEPLMSIKTWLAGGECLLIKSWGVGHLYRDKNPYPVFTANLIYNSLLLIALFSPAEGKERYFANYAARVPNAYPAALALFEEKLPEIEAHKKYLKSIFQRDLNWFLININDKVK